MARPGDRTPESGPPAEAGPRSDSAPASSVPAPLTTRDGGVPRVLVIDDDALVRSVVLRALERAGVEVTVAASGDQALELMRRSAARFDAALIDTTMPGMSGVEALRAMRLLDPGLRAALISGLDSERARADQVAAGAEAVLMKPFSPRALLDTVARLLSL